MRVAGRSWVVVLCAAQCVCFAACACAQESDKSAFSDLRAELEGRRLARVTASWGVARLAQPRVQGTRLTYASVLPDTSGLEATAVPDSIPFLDVRRVELRESRAVEGGLVGALVFGLVGAVLGSGMPDFGDWGPPPTKEERLRGALVPVLVLGTGTAGGAWLGSRVHYWRTVWPR